MATDVCEFVVGADDGFAETKIAIYSRKKGFISKSTISSRARSGPHGASGLNALAASSAIGTGYETEGSQFTVGDLAGTESASFEAYPFSAMNRAIVAHALRVAGMGGKNIEITTGLPLATYFRDGAPDEEVIAAKIASLAKPINALDEQPLANIKKHGVYAEGLAAYIDYAVDDFGGLRVPIESETVAVIDVGGRTTDIAVIRPNGALDHKQSGSENIGVLAVVEAISAAVNAEYKCKVDPSRVQNSLRTGMLSLWGKPYDISEIIGKCKADVFGKLMREVNRRLGDANDIDKMLLVGGGANLFKSLCDIYPHMIIPEDPEFSNARGFAKFQLID